MVNKVILIGNLGQDPELRSTSGGTSVASLRLATTERVKDRDGNWSDKTEWHSVVVWGKQAESVNTYCHKGKQLYIEGRLQTRKWQDKDGKDRYSTEVVAENVRFLGGKGEDERDERREEPRHRSPAPEPRRNGPSDVPDDEVPY